MSGLCLECILDQVDATYKRFKIHIVCKDTIKRVKCLIYLDFFECEYLRASLKFTNFSINIVCKKRKCYMFEGSFL